MNYENNVEIQDLESSIETWMLSDPLDAEQTFGEDVISAVTEALENV